MNPRRRRYQRLRRRALRRLQDIRTQVRFHPGTLPAGLCERQKFLHEVGGSQ